MGRAFCLTLVLIFATTAGGVGAFSGPEFTNSPAETAPISAEVTVNRPSTTLIEYSIEFDWTDEVSEVQFTALSSRAEISQTSGFRVDGFQAHSNGNGTGAVTVSYSLDTNQAASCQCVVSPTFALVKPIYATISYDIQDTTHRTTLYPRDESAGIVTSTSIRESGTSGPGFLLLGKFHRASIRISDETKLSVLSPVSEDGPTANVSQRTALLSTATEGLPVGPTNNHHIHFLIVPDVSSVDGSPAFNDWLTNPGGTKRSFAYVQASAGNRTWFHEYVHTRQQFQTVRDSRWLTEALASYLSHLMLVRTGEWSTSEFRTRLNRPTSHYPGGTLSDPDSWVATGTKYQKGEVVIAYIDQRIREETNRTSTIVDVFARLNDQTYVGHDQFKDAVAAVVGDHRLDDEIDRYVTTDANPANHEYLYVVGKDPGITVTPTPTISPTPTTPQTERSAQEKPTTSGASLETSHDEGRSSTSPGLGMSVVIVALLLSIALSYRRRN